MRKSRLSPYIGLLFDDVSPSDLNSVDFLSAVKSALGTDHLAVIRAGEISSSQLVDIAEHFGRPKAFHMTRYRHPDYPEIMISSNEQRDGVAVGVARVGNFWHQDSSYIAKPPQYTLLSGVVIPETSGETLFASAVDVYRRLPDEWKERIERRRARHTVDKRHRIEEEHVGLSIAEFKALVNDKYPKVWHDLVKTVEDTGEKYLYASSDYLDAVEGFDANENAAFIALLERLIEGPDHVYVHHWQTHDLLIWNTQTALHAATPIARGLSRTVHRISIDRETT
ncbi:TauD/TfdA dioxygenase family protein [Neokomagataea thailandica]|uniref:Taurine dioxygenase n=1 Tax=Neokomagataea tanensis NBRC 106556 TaxID=1223519 RepID=A0ABQ0QL78_9PROT|nr:MULTISPECIES: TauD/TfdA family dioxygenase [Neokomagataea]GBR48964.1 taurine dioxygenase [Neokomagataea tanensis NBRC 106556]